MRGIKPGWYAIEDDGNLSSGLFHSRQKCVRESLSVCPCANFGARLPESCPKKRRPIEVSAPIGSADAIGWHKSF